MRQVLGLLIILIGGVGIYAAFTGNYKQALAYFNHVGAKDSKGAGATVASVTGQGK